MKNEIRKEMNEYDEIFLNILSNEPEKQIDNDLFFKLKNSDKYNNGAIFSDLDIVIYLRNGYASIDKEDLKILKEREEEKKAIERFKRNFKQIAIKEQVVKGNMDMKRIKEQNNILMEMLKELK